MDFMIARQLTLNELEDSKFLGKCEIGSDMVLGAEIMEKELREYSLSISLANSISKTKALPKELIASIVQQDEEERRDREFAISLANTSDQEIARQFEKISLHSGNAELSLNNKKFDSQEASKPSSSKSLISAPDYESISKAHSDSVHLPIKKSERIECVACNTAETGEFMLQCNHPYCRPCLRDLGKASLRDRSLIPLSCCKTALPLKMIDICFDSAQLIKYEQFLHEVLNPVENVVELDLSMSSLINQNSWKICVCGAVVERGSGCVHMTCFNCKHEFCYTCMKQWRNCICELYPVAELNRILNERIAPGQDQEPLRQVLQNYYDHAHSWQYKRLHSETSICISCHWAMPDFAMICSMCKEVRCRRCTYNR